VLSIRSSLLTVVTFTAVLIIVLYALIAISALVSRTMITDPEAALRRLPSQG
jgi:hypothetical protein